MPHYKDGTEATIGDVVRGKGYNVLHEIVGKVVGITPGSASCNIQVAHVVTVPIEGGHAYPNYQLFTKTGVIGCGSNGGAPSSDSDKIHLIGAYVNLEYGQCDAFEKIA